MRNNLIVHTRKPRTGDFNEVLLIERILGIARIELNDLLNAVKGSDIDGHGMLRDKEGNPLGAGRRGERASILEQALGFNVLLQNFKVEWASLGECAGRNDFADIAEGLREEFGGCARLGKFKVNGNDSNGSVWVKLEPTALA